jgi:fructose-1,6-bisphosphatase/inositol monophosphatase family enzyme
VEATGAVALALVEVAAGSTAVAVDFVAEVDSAAAEYGWAAVDALSALGLATPVHFQDHRLEAAGHMPIADMRAAGRA